MWKNKHVVVAMLVAPVLAILAWFAVDTLVAERPEAAKPGQAYPLVARPNCRYQSGRCDLDNVDFRISLERDVDGVRLQSQFALSGGQLAIGRTPEELDAPVALEPLDAEGLEWRIPLTEEPREGELLRIAVVADQSTYFAETSADFLTTGAER